MIAGYTKGQGRRSGRFGALVLGVWRGDELAYVGQLSAPGSPTGTSTSCSRSCGRWSRPSHPFPAIPKMPKVRKADVVWVRPELVCEVEFVEWTHDGRLRAPSFQGLRDDKPAREVHREEPLPAELRKGKRVLKLSNLDKVFLPDERDHEGRPARLLPRRRAGLAPAHSRPAVHDEALPRRDRGRPLLPEGRAEAHARVDPDPRASRSRRASRRAAGGRSRRRS